MRTGTTMVALVGLALALALGGCGGNLFGSSSLDLFSTSSKATSGGDNVAGVGSDANATDVECPSVDVRTGAATLLIGSTPGGGEPSPLDVRYQGSIIRTARECRVNAGVMTMKVGIEGRLITGPAGGPGTVEVPLRVAVVHEGTSPKAIVSKLGLRSGDDRRRGRPHHAASYRPGIDPDFCSSRCRSRWAISTYVVYVGFRSGSARRRKRRSSVKKKPAAKLKDGGQAEAELSSCAVFFRARNSNNCSSWPGPGHPRLFQWNQHGCPAQRPTA